MIQCCEKWCTKYIWILYIVMMKCKMHIFSMIFNKQNVIKTILYETLVILNLLNIASIIANNNNIIIIIINLNCEKCLINEWLVIHL